MMEFILSPWSLAGFVASLIGGGVAMWAFFPTIAATLVTTKAGRTALIALLVLVGVWFVLMRVFAAGESKAMAKQKEQSLKNLRDRLRTDDEVRSMPIDERKRRLQEWSRG